MSVRLRDRFFAALASVGTRHPVRVLVPVAVILIASAALIPGIGVSTSRYALVAEDEPVQARLMRFFARFGFPDAPLFVIEGGTGDERRRVVDLLLAKLDRVPQLQGRILGRVGPREVAEVIFMQRPEMLASFSEGLADGRQPADVIEAGLPAIVESMHGQLNTLALALQMQALMPFNRTVSPEQTVEVLAGLEGLAGAATKALGGDDIFHRLMQADNNPHTKSNLIDEYGYTTTSDGQAHIVAMFPELESDEVEYLEPLVEEIRRLRDEAIAEAGADQVVARLTGIPTLAVDEMHHLKAGIKLTSITAGIGIALLFLFAFRSLRQTILAAAPLLVGVVTTIAIARLLFGRLNLVTSSFIPVLMGLAIDFAVHTLARYNEFLRAGKPRIEAIEGAIVLAGPAIVTGALTTALGFFVTITTGFTAFQELGILTALGLCIALFGTFIVIPPLIASSKIFAVAAAPEIPGLSKLPVLVSRRPRLILGTALALAVLAALMLPRLRMNSRYFDFLPDDTESAIALLRLENDRALSPVFAVLSAESMAEARDIADRARALPEVGTVQAATDLVPPLTPVLLDDLRSLLKAREPDWTKFARYPTKAEELLLGIDGLIDAVDRIGFSMEMTGQSPQPAKKTGAALHGFRAALLALPDHGTPVLQRLQRQVTEVGIRAWRTAVNVARRGHYTPEDLPPIMQVRFASLDRKAAAVYVFPNGDIWDHEFGERFKTKLEAIDPEVTGFAITAHHHFGMIEEGFKRAAVIVSVLVLFLLLADFRRLSDTLLAMVPLGFGWLWMFGLMGLLDLPFNHANIVSLALIPGIGIAAGVHIIHRCRESAGHHPDGKGRLSELLRGTGGAVLVSALTTMAGFAGLLFADYGAMTSMGITMVIGVGTCGFASLVLLPAILVVAGRAR